MIRRALSSSFLTLRFALFLLLALQLAASTALRADGNSTLLVDVDHRASISLDGDWHAIVDPYGSGLYGFHGAVLTNGYFMNAPSTYQGGPEYSFAKSPTLKVPGDWNTQRDSLFFYEGPLWYQRDFDYQPKPHTRVFLHIGAANYKSYVWVNAKKACEHEGGFTPFDCEVTSLVHEGSNFAVIAVDNTRQPENVPTLQTDWWNYGGLTRDVSLVEVPEQFVDDYELHLKRGGPAKNGAGDQIEGWVHVEGATAGTKVSVNIPGLEAINHSITDNTARAPIHFDVKGLTRWSPETPKLYKVEIQAGDDNLEDEIGFRTIETSGTKILLNGKPIFLRGICIHAEAPYRTGRAWSEQDAQTLLGWVKELGGNYVRLAHYPHDQRMTRLADKMGILVWSEVPVYWAVQFEKPEVLAKAQQQLGEMIRRDRDKASVILWSVANETPNNPARTAFLKTMVETAHTQDPTRLVTAALLVKTNGNIKTVDDPLGEVLDVVGANEYVGWYEHKPEDADDTEWHMTYDKPLIMSEFGGESKAGMHGPVTERFTEEYQANLYRHQLVMLNKIPQLRGMSPWILMDFRSPRRATPGLQDYFNRKGLISEHGEKKAAFFVLQRAYKEKTIGKAE